MLPPSTWQKNVLKSVDVACERLQTSIRIYGVTSQKIIVCTVAAVRTLNLTSRYLIHFSKTFFGKIISK
jgi:hypothetical protein